MTTKKGLDYIQANLNAPKGQFNNFGKYKYRSCEDILGALKPLLAEVGGSLTITDEIVLVGDRYYVKATAIVDITGTPHTATGYAREPENKKGMDESQITGAASSYARKYALNGLFAIDDTQDADATNDHGKGAPAVSAHAVAPPLTPTQITDNMMKALTACVDLSVLTSVWNDKQFQAELKTLSPEQTTMITDCKDMVKTSMKEGMKEVGNMLEKTMEEASAL